MPNALEINYGWFRYTCDDGTFRAVKADALWGANAASGLTAFNAADAPFPSKSRRYHPRYVLLADAATGRTTRRVAGSTTATSWTSGTFTTPIGVRGLQTTITYTKVGTVGEKIPRPRAIIAKPEASAAA